MSPARHQAVVADIIPMISDDAPRTFRRHDDSGYELRIDALGIGLRLAHQRRDRHELIGELIVECDMAGARTVAGVLSAADFNLSSLRARQERARHLEARSNAKDVDWLGLLEQRQRDGGDDVGRDVADRHAIDRRLEAREAGTPVDRL